MISNRFNQALNIVKSSNWNDLSHNYKLEIMLKFWTMIIGHYQNDYIDITDFFRETAKSFFKDQKYDERIIYQKANKQDMIYILETTLKYYKSPFK